MRHFLLSLLVFLCGPLPGSPYLVKDIRDAAGSGDSKFGPSLKVGGKVFFAALDTDENLRLWVTDGTLPGTQALFLIEERSMTVVTGVPLPITPFYQTVQMIEMDGRVYFLAKDQDRALQMCVSDGTVEGSRMVRRIVGGKVQTIGPPYAKGGYVYYIAEDPEKGRQLWRTDGTEAGTQRVSDVPQGAASTLPLYVFGERGGEVLFGASFKTWITDGTMAGTREFCDTPTATLFNNKHVAVLGSVFISVRSEAATGAELWRSDGTPAGTYLLKDIYPGSSIAAAMIENLIVYNGVVYFSATTPQTGSELWRTDGTTQGTYIVKDFAAGTGSTSPFRPFVFNGYLFYQGAYDNTYYNLYRSDGTAAGTVKFGTICRTSLSTALNPAGSMPVQFKGELYFGNNELRASDGTVAGTRLVKDITGDTVDSFPHVLGVSGDRLFFTARSSGQSTARDLWCTDGTPQGTVKVSATAPEQETDSTYFVNDASGRLVFRARHAILGTELHASDGTPGGTGLLKNMNTATGDSGASQLFAVGETVFFSADDGVHGRELWKSDGTSGGTVMVRDVAPGLTGSFPQQFIRLGNSVYFATAQSADGHQGLWKTDGTEEGTVRVSSQVPVSLRVFNELLFFYTSTGALWVVNEAAGTVSILTSGQGVYSTVGVNGLAVLGSWVYFIAYHEKPKTGGGVTTGRSLWRTQGKGGGTELVCEILPELPTAGVYQLTAAGGRLNFAVTVTTTNPRELRWWQSDGTAEGTVPLGMVYSSTGVSNNSSLAATFYETGGGVLHHHSFLNPSSLWASDGTPAGTQSVITRGPWYGTAAVFDGALYWSEVDRFYRSRGTAATTGQWLDLLPVDGPTVSYFQAANFRVADGRLYFFGKTDGGPYQLWSSDGSVPGTFMERVLPESGMGGYPAETVATPTHLFWVQNRTGVGRELHAMPLHPEMTVQDEAADAVGTGDTLDFGPGGAAGLPVTRTLTVKNHGLRPLLISQITADGTHGADFTTPGLTFPLVVKPGYDLAVPLSFRPLGQGARTATLHLHTNDVDLPVLDLQATGSGFYVPPEIHVQPSSALFTQGRPGSLQVGTLVMNPGYQWQKEGRDVTGASALTDTLGFNRVTAQDVGVYRLAVTHADGTLLSDPAYVGVMVPAPLPELTVIRENGALTLQAAVKVHKDTSLRYEWQRDGEVLSTADKRIVGEDKEKVTITGLKAEDRGTYSCRIQMRKGAALLAEAVYPATRLHVVTETPEITPPVLPVVYVNQPVSLPVHAEEYPTRYSAAGLPPGVKMDALTGVISGKPTAAKKLKGEAVPYQVKITVTNMRGSTTSEVIPWTILELPEELCGNFEALVARHAGNQNLGGWVRLAILPTGAVSGSGLLRGKKLSFRAQAESIYQVSGFRLAYVNVDVANGKLPPVSLALAIRKVAGIPTARGTWGGAEVAGWQCPYSVKNPFSTSGSINTALIFSGGSATGTGSSGRPRGDGFAVVKISKTGTVTWAGTLADGTAFTASHLLGRSDGAGAPTATLLHASLYTATGSVQGQYDILPGPPLRLEGGADWFKGVQPEKVKSQDYKDGFGPLDVSLLGQIYERPGAGELVLGMDPKLIKNGVLTLEEGGLAGFDYLTLGNDVDADGVPVSYGVADFPFQISSNGTGVYKPWDASLSATLKTKLLLTVAPATGQISGSFYLQTPQGVSPLRSTKVPLSGLIIQHPGLQAGVGFFRMFQREAGQFPPVPAKAPYESGRVRLGIYAGDSE